MTEVVKPLNNNMWFSLEQWEAMKALQDKQAFEAGLKNIKYRTYIDNGIEITYIPLPDIDYKDYEYINHKRIKRQFQDERRNQRTKN